MDNDAYIAAAAAFRERFGPRPTLTPEEKAQDAGISWISSRRRLCELGSESPWRGKHLRCASERLGQFLTLLDSLEGALPLARASDLSDEPLARTIFQLSEGLIGEIVAIVSAAATAAARSGAERITKSELEQLRYIPVSKRRQAPARDGLL